MNKQMARTMEWARWTLLGAIAAGSLCTAQAVAQTAYPEFTVGQATGSGLQFTVLQEPLPNQSPSDAPAITPVINTVEGLPVGDEIEADGAVALADALEGDGDWGLDSVVGSPSCGCCPPGFYVIGEALAINREGNAGLRLSQSIILGEFHYREGFRATIGWTNDCLNGYEFVFTRPFEWNRLQTATSAGTLQSNFVAAANFNPADLTGFNDAFFHSHRYRSELYSGEFNRRWWGWDVFSVKLGLRYVNVDEEFEFLSTAAVNTAEFRVESDNHLIGPQLGVDMTRPIGRWTIQTKFVGAAFININDAHTTLRNGPTTWINNSVNDEDFAWMLETGVYAVYHFTDRLSARVGYEGWFIDGLVIAAEQTHNPIDVNMGLSSGARGDILYHGASAGVELVW